MILTEFDSLKCIQEPPIAVWIYTYLYSLGDSWVTLQCWQVYLKKLQGMVTEKIILSQTDNSCQNWLFGAAKCHIRIYVIPFYLPIVWMFWIERGLKICFWLLLLSWTSYKRIFHFLVYFTVSKRFEDVTKTRFSVAIRIRSHIFISNCMIDACRILLAGCHLMLLHWGLIIWEKKKRVAVHSH